jgi:ADP-ribosyl-[dinitrogen reductase] hydrolase
MKNNTYNTNYKKYKKLYSRVKNNNSNSNSNNSNNSNNNNNNNNMIINKIKNTICGVVYGDAFGSRYEFKTAREAGEEIDNDFDKVNNVYPIKGGGFFHVEAGQVTDDSEMMFGLLESIVNNKEYVQTDVARNYIRWFDTKPVDVGNTIKRALCTRKRAINNIDMVENSYEMNHESLSNGTLMRIAPLGIWGLTMTDDELFNLVKLECELTHPNELVVDMCFIYCLAIKYSIKGINEVDMTKKEIYDLVLDRAKYPRTKIILRDSLYVAEPSYIIDRQYEMYIDSDNKKFQGYIGIALQNTFYEFMHSDNPAISIVNVARRGGDTDTNCAITGGLMGAFYGINNNAFPNSWYETIKIASNSVKRYYDFPFLKPIDKMEQYSTKLYKIISKKN